MEPGPADLEFVSFLTTSALPQAGGSPRTRYRHRAFFVGSEVCGLARSGQLEYVPIRLEEIPRLLTSGRLPIDVALLQVSPPDARGFVSLGVSVDLTPAVLSVARTVIAEINPAMPRTHGETFVHLSRFDAVTRVDSPVTKYRHPKIGEVAERVARYIASIIEDGSTLHIGLGRVPNEALRHLRDRRDLGIHSDVITDGLVDLVEAGVVTGRCKTRYRDRIVASYCLGTRQLYDFVDNNPTCQFLPIDQVCHREEVARQSRMVSITQAFAIDLTGQVCVDQFEGEFYGGVSTQVVFMRGAARFRRRQAHRLPFFHHRNWRFEHQTTAGGGRCGGDRAVGRALRDHRVWHCIPLRKIDSGASAGIDRGSASTLARDAADFSQATGLRSV